jgi:hypothetical protein
MQNRDNKSTFSRVMDTLLSLKVTIVCLLMLMVLVVACTLAQVDMGTNGAVNAFMRSFIVWWKPAGQNFSLPVFPGGATVGFVLGFNLIASQLRGLARTWAKLGLWLVHIGLILLVAAEFISAAFQVDARLTIEEGQTVDYIERPTQFELSILDTTDPKLDDVYGVPEPLLKDGGTIAIPGTPIALRVHGYFKNTDLARREPKDPPSMATMGVGTDVTVKEAPPVTADDERNRPVAYVEPLAGTKSYGTWLVAAGMGAPQSFIHEGHTYQLSMRPRREYLPYKLTLKKFSHDVYAGTDIPKNFSSLVHLVDRGAGEERDVLIFMNQPLRYAGRTFYQASFGKNDTLSVLQVVENPGWLLPYISCSLVTLGLLIHFAMSLRRAQRKRQRQAAAVATPAVTAEKVMA